MLDLSAFDLSGYAQRLGFADEASLKSAPLARIHRAHLEAIPFENLDVLLRRPMPLDIGALQAKLVTGTRGGYCFETNLLLMAALQTLGNRVRPLAARVLYRTTKTLPRTHMLLLIAQSDGDVIADVGFGGAGLLEPIKLEPGTHVDQGLGRFSLRREGDLWQLSTEDSGRPVAIYEFGLEQQTIADLEMAHYYVSTHPASRFTETLVCQRVRPTERLTVRNFELEQKTLGQVPVVTKLADHQSVMATLRDRLMLTLPVGAEEVRYGRTFS